MKKISIWYFVSFIIAFLLTAYDETLPRLIGCASWREECGLLTIGASMLFTLITIILFVVSIFSYKKSNSGNPSNKVLLIAEVATLIFGLLMYLIWRV